MQRSVPKYPIAPKQCSLCAKVALYYAHGQHFCRDHHAQAVQRITFGYADRKKKAVA